MKKVFFTLNLSSKLKKLLAKGTTITIQDANLNERAFKLLASSFNAYYSPNNKGLLILTPKDSTVLEYEAHKNNRIQKIIQIDKNNNKTIVFNVYGPPTKKRKKNIIF